MTFATRRPHCSSWPAPTCRRSADHAAYGPADHDRVLRPPLPRLPPERHRPPAAINPTGPDRLPIAASAAASVPSAPPRKMAEAHEFAAPLLQPIQNGEIEARAPDLKSRHLPATCSWSGISGSNRRHSAWEADTLPTELNPQTERYVIDRSAEVKRAECRGRCSANGSTQAFESCRPWRTWPASVSPPAFGVAA